LPGKEVLLWQIMAVIHESIPLIEFLCYTVLSERRRAVWPDDLKV
jgi:hypothetical protein